MGQYEKDKAELLEKIEKLEHKLKKAKQEGDKDDVDKYSRSSPTGARNSSLGRKRRHCGFRLSAPSSVSQAGGAGPAPRRS